MVIDWFIRALKGAKKRSGRTVVSPTYAFPQLGRDIVSPQDVLVDLIAGRG